MAAEVDFEGFSEGSLESLGGGRWRARFSRTTAHGREQVSHTFQAKGKRGARRRAEEIRRGLDERERRWELPMEVTDEDMLLPNFQERYIGALEAGDGIAPTTAANYRHCARHVCRYLGKARVDEITGDMVLRMQSMLLADELCPNTVARAHRFLKQALRYAVDEGIIARSPFTRHVKAPRRTQPEPNSLDRDGRERLLSWLDSVGDTEMTLAIRLGLACGLRREEMCGLRWRDVNLDLHLLRVRVAVSQCEGKAFVKGPKTPRSRRDVPLEPDLEARLARRRKRVARECSPEARERVGDLYVLGNARGNYYYPDRLSKEFGPISKMLDLRGTTGRRIGLHDLRHTYATYLVAAGTDIKTVSSLMKHANAAMTLNTYASADPDARASALETIARQMAARPRRDVRRRPALSDSDDAESEVWELRVV